MTANTLIEPANAPSGLTKDDTGASNNPDVLVCVDIERDSTAMIDHAKAVATAFDAGVILVGVIEPPSGGIPAVDPVDWDIRRREASRHLANLASRNSSETREIKAKVLEGHPADQICNCTSKDPIDIIAIPKSPPGDPWPSDAVACGAMASNVSAILTVPTVSRREEAGIYHRVLVPLDGSANAESAIPSAVKLAKVHGGELLLCHVVPEPVLTEIGPADAETARLKDSIARHNEKAGQSYLNNVKHHLADCGLPVSTRLLVDGDPRRSLVESIETEDVDIVVMASHGRSGHADVSAGNVASFILDRSLVPVLITRQPRRDQSGHVVHDLKPAGIRHPADSAQ